MGIAIHPGKRLSATPSRVAGRYELQEKLGEGGMGVVWRALDSKTGSDVAIKIMKDISDPAALELFTKEWKALAEMCHPNIVDVRDVDILEDEKERRPFFVMPLFRGATLADLIANSSARLTVARMVEIITQVCRGLQAAHSKGLIHRDLKPSNIFVMDDDTAKIIDFGVVYLAGSHSVTGQKGTFQYMSPEQVQMKEITPASDIFALGVILYEGLTGRKPFASATAEETMHAVLKRIPPPVTEINASIPQGIGRVVHKCLAKQPIHRFSSARELAETLGRALRNEPIFEGARLQPRIERAKAAFKAGDEAFASEVLAEMESEGHLEPEITVLRMQIEVAMRAKKIRQLLESARARIESDEIPLGLDKLREVLELDPENADALALRASTEKQRGEAQAGKWLDLAQTHLSNRDFAAARHAVDEALASRRGDPRALDLLGRIDATELEATRIREQKEQLYSTAMKEYQNGEIDAALSRLVRLFSVVRANPEAAVPERDAVYESFYKEVRSEHDGIRSRLDEAQHQLSEKNFPQALALCAEHLAKYPNDGAFQALKIQIEDAERQEVSAYIAAISRSVEAEPDLDRRAHILREACERYPGEAQFAQQLKVVRERRDLVNSIIAKARQFDERGQYGEALGQWDILRNIHPRYPGLAFELEQCKKKRDRLAAEEDKARLVEEIVGLMESRAFARALERARLALEEYALDAELQGLERLAADGLERTQQARQLLEAGQLAAEEKDLPRAIELLRNALRLDPRNPSLRDAVVTVLTERARALVDQDWAEATRLHEEASGLDANHRAVRALGSALAEVRRQSRVGECLTQARALVATGDLAAALETIREGRREYPRDARLEQFEASLVKDSGERKQREERGRSWVELADMRGQFERNPDSASARRLLELSQALRARHPRDPETEQLAEEAEQSVRRLARRDDLSQFLTPGTAVRPGLAAAYAQDATNTQAATETPDQTRLLPADPASTPPARADLARKASPHSGEGKLQSFSLRSAGGIGVLTALAACVAMVAITYQHVASGRHPAPAHLLPATAALRLRVEPADSTVRVDGVASSAGVIQVPAAGSVVVEVSRLGYQSKALRLGVRDARTEQRISLDPENVRVSVQTAEKNGSLLLDGERAGELADGASDALEVAPGNHTLAILSGGRRLATIAFDAQPGEAPVLHALDRKDNKELLVIATLGAQATVYGGEPLKTAMLADHRITLRNAGVALPPLSDQDHDLRLGDKGEGGSVAIAVTGAPSLMVRSLSADPEVLVTSNVTSGADKAVLTANGDPLKPGKHGWQMSGKPGTYSFVLAADGYEPQTWTTVLRNRQTISRNVVLAKKASAPALSSLVLTNGTPGVEVALDGKQLGTLDASGAAQFPRILSAGSHAVTLHKAGYCEDRSLEFEVTPPVEARIADATLSPCGSITLRSGARPATVRVRRAGLNRWLEVAAGARVAVAAGTYDLVAEASGSATYSAQIKVEAGQNTDVAPRLEPLQKCQLADAAQAIAEGEWLRPRNAGNFLSLKPGCTRVSLSFSKPKASLLGKRKVQWQLQTADQAARIEYELEDGKLTRRVTVGRNTLDAKQAHVSADQNAASFTVLIAVEGSRLKITDAKGATLDDYTSSDPALHDLASGRLALKTNALFTVRSSY